jgi:polyisoprenyl-teichoic acid--peptidoglycan teichoic acid transferase
MSTLTPARHHAPVSGPDDYPNPSPRRRRRRRDPLWARLVMIAGALLMVLSGGAIVGGKALLTKLTSSVEQAPLLGDAGTKMNSIVGPLNILLVGIDERPNNDEGARADSIMILHVTAAHDQAYLTSIPRDLQVEIPPFEKTKFRGSTEKINAAYFYGSQNGGGRAGGFQLLALTVKRLTGIERFNAGAIVNFDGFGAVVRALGGVDMCVDTKEPVVSIHVGFDSKGNFLAPRDGGKPATYYPGCHRFAPWQALDYVRQREGPGLPNGDYDRARHQRQFIKAIAAEARKQGVTTNPMKLYQVVNAAGKALTVDTNGIGLDTWLFTLRNLTSDDLVMISTNAGKLNTVNCGGAACEALTTESATLYEHMRTDTVGDFLVSHPEFINTT